MIGHKRRAGGFVISVGIACARARAALDEDLVAAFDELIRGGRQERHPVFMVFDFFGNADNHRRWSLMTLELVAAKKETVAGLPES